MKIPSQADKREKKIIYAFSAFGKYGIFMIFFPFLFAARFSFLKYVLILVDKRSHFMWNSYSQNKYIDKLMVVSFLFLTNVFKVVFKTIQTSNINKMVSFFF